jgi:hypothetical protein
MPESQIRPVNRARFDWLFATSVIWTMFLLAVFLYVVFAA